MHSKKTSRLPFIILLLFFGFETSAQDLSLFVKKVYVHKGDTLNYRILYPKDYDSTKKYPVILFLHGAGERGHDNEKQLAHGTKLFLNDSLRTKFPAIVIFPQCPSNSYWSNVQINITKQKREFIFQKMGNPTPILALAQSFLKDFLAEGKADTKRIYVIGLSMGGMGTFEIVYRNPKLFAAAVPICGGANPEMAKKFSEKTAIWIFHGADDQVVSAEYSRQMFEALKKEGKNVKYTEYPGVDHDSWNKAFAEPELLPWLFLQSLKK